MRNGLAERLAESMTEAVDLYVAESGADPTLGEIYSAMVRATAMIRATWKLGSGNPSPPLEVSKWMQ